jgi:hypothetical protein
VPSHFVQLTIHYEEFNTDLKRVCRLIYICNWCVIEQAQCKALSATLHLALLEQRVNREQKKRIRCGAKCMVNSLVINSGVGI